MNCQTEDLGAFDECEEIVIDEITESVNIMNYVTEWSCTFTAPEIGRLARGIYFFSVGGVDYLFEVV